MLFLSQHRIRLRGESPCFLPKTRQPTRWRHRSPGDSGVVLFRAETLLPNGKAGASDVLGDTSSGDQLLRTDRGEYMIQWGDTADLFYRGQFTRVLDQITSGAFGEGHQSRSEPKDSSEEVIAPSWVFQWVRWCVLLEQHRVEECKEVLDVWEQQRSWLVKPGIEADFFSLVLDLSRARLLGRLREFGLAREILIAVAERLEKKGTMSIGVHTRMGFLWDKIFHLCILERGELDLTLGRFADVAEVIKKLERSEPFEELDIKLAFMLLRSRYASVVARDDRTALSFANKCYGEAIQCGWTYFSGRAQILMAIAYNQLQEPLKYGLTLSLLRLSLEGSEHQYLTYLVNDQFKQDFVVETPMEFDSRNKRIFLSGQWIALHDRPILFDFLYLLHEKEDFTSKKVISERLWPDEQYKPRVHDPRIFDIAKRVRSMIEPYRHQPLTLLSGRMGYKLASH